MFYTCQVMVKPARTPSNSIAPEVLRAALEILDDEGPDGFTVRAIAQEAGVAPMAIYNHFDGLNGVVEALWNEGFDLLRRAITFDTGAPGDDLTSAALGYRGFALSNRGLYTLMFMHRFRNFQPSPAAARMAAQAFGEIVLIVERAQGAGIFAGARARDAAQVVWAACHGYVALELLGINFAADPDETYALLLATLRDGFN